MVFCCLLAHSAVCQKPVWMTSKFKVTPCLLLSLHLTWFCLALGGSGCRRSGSCRRTATDWRPPGPSAEPSPHGWALRHLWQCACRISERTMWDRGIQDRETLSGWKTVITAWISAHRVTMKMHQISNLIELNLWGKMNGLLICAVKLNWTIFLRTPILAV